METQFTRHSTNNYKLIPDLEYINQQNKESKKKIQDCWGYSEIFLVYNLFRNGLKLELRLSGTDPGAGCNNQ